ncbi:MAG: hypothetical protein H7061_02035 [Bdellovibrionaceae bacterium]|nr:hypothetical protein [Bdellovibrio sp.]
MKNLKSFFAICILLCTFNLRADVIEMPPSAHVRPPVELDFPLVDLPFNSTSYFPNLYSMQQSLSLSTDFYETAHSVLGGHYSSNNWYRIFYVAGFDLLTSAIPLSSSWMHEEWHRSVMSSRGIGSFNDVNTFPIGSPLIAVSHVDDIDLVNLKRDHPADQVRLSAAGMESQVAQNMLIEKHHFFNGLRSLDQIILLENNFSVTFYLATCASKDADKTTDEQNTQDGTDLRRRDFTGLDCTAWVYDLFRPKEPYAARGTHPSGVGADRYIRYSDLNSKEKDFLSLQAALSLLNFADPFLFRKDEFDGEFSGTHFKWNAKLNHYITSFGATVDANLFLKLNDEKYLVTWHNGMTDTRYLPGITLEWIETETLCHALFASTGFTIWQQPKDQMIEDKATTTLAAASAQLLYRLNERFATYLGIELKNEGWLAGNVYLDRNLSAQAGLKATVF